MKKISIFILVAILINVAYPQNRSDLDEFILEQMEIKHVPGLSAVIIIDDTVNWNGNYGYMNLADSIPVHDSTIFNIFSIGKAVTTSCVMQLWDKGLLGIDQNINDFIPFYIKNTNTGSDSITARMLASHSSSLKEPDYVDYFLYGDPTESLASFLENYYCESGSYYYYNHFSFQNPGTIFYYNNSGIGLLGYLVEPLTGLYFDQYARDSLLLPLEMNRSAWFLSELDTMDLATGYSYVGGFFTPWGHLGHPAYPGITLRSTALELANFCIMLLNEGSYKGMQILSPEAVSTMATVQDPNWSTAYGTAGLGLFMREDLGDRVVWGHNGGSGAGYAAHMYFCDDENTGVVITTNSEQYMPVLVEYLFDYALSVATAVPEKITLSPVPVKIFPNPATTGISIDCKHKIIGLKVFDISGNQLDIGPGIRNVDISNLNAGIYILEVVTEEGLAQVKFIKK
ncbi:MAG TPA: serine hydrolase [Bacteroidales bacterium]|nr:serine hydrolase [Bacteroidales bacterium]